MEYFYYFRDSEKKPLVTVCLLEQDGQYARGVAYCSFKDNPSKRIGRNIAKGRAVRALKRRGRNDIVNRDEVYAIADAVKISPFRSKSSYPIELDYFEKKVLFGEAEDG